MHILDGGITAWETRVSRSTVARNAGTSSARSASSPARSCSTSMLGSIAAPKLKWVAAGVGGGLTFAALSNTCAMGMMLSKLPYNRGATCDAQTVVAQLIGSPADQKVG